MEPIYIVNEQELIDLVSLDASVVESIAKGFSELKKGNAIVPPIMMLPVDEKEGEVDIKSAFIKGLDQMAVKVASGFFQNPKMGLPSGSGLMLVVSAETGFLDGVLLDNGYLTHVRTGAAGAVAAQYLAPKNATQAGVIGAGAQARFQMRALALVRDIKTIRMFSLDDDAVRDQYVKDMEAELGIEVIKAGSVEEVVRGSQVVVTTTPSRKAFIKPEWIHANLHITAMGSDTEGKQELEAEVLAKADILACDMKSQVYRLGEVRSAIEAGLLTKESPLHELGEFVNGDHPGRSSDESFTVCDLTGVGVQDTMIALMAYKMAKDKDIGIKISR